MRHLFVAAALILAACASSVPTTTDTASSTSTTATTGATTAPTSTPTTSSTSAPTTAAPSTESTSAVDPPEEEPVTVRTGAQVLVDDDLAALRGMRVGLIAHQPSTVVVDGVTTHLADVIDADPDVELVALFGPEHGIRGAADAGETVDDEIDPGTGVRVWSLYGQTRRPTPAMLDGLDVLVYDLQDVGVRYYTYISTMGLAMQAASEQGVRFVVLDRPNPLGGTVAGGVLDASRTSFVGQYPIPDQYGLTSGELAAAIVDNGWLEGLDGLDLAVIEMDGWVRSMRWPDTGLDWVAPSPALDTVDAALLYPATIWLEATTLNYGRGTDRPFRVFGAPWVDAELLTTELTSRGLPGVAFSASAITPRRGPTDAVDPAHVGLSIPAVTIEVTDAATLDPARLGLHLLDALADHAAARNAELLARPDWLDQLSGSTTLRDGLDSGDFDPQSIATQQQRQRETVEAALRAAHRYS